MTDRTLVDENYEAFKAVLPDLLKTKAGKYAVIHDKKLDLVFDTSSDAYIYGSRAFKQGEFIVQEITNKPIHLGFYSLCHALQ